MMRNGRHSACLIALISVAFVATGMLIPGKVFAATTGFRVAIFEADITIPIGHACMVVG